MAAFVFISFGYVTGSVVVILELQRRFLRYSALALIFNGVLNVLLIPRYGFIAAAWVTLLTEVLVMSLMTRRILSTLTMRPSLNRVIRTIVAATAMGLLTWGARILGTPLAGLAVVAGVSYLLCVALLQVLTIGEVKAVLRKEPLPANGN
jgi:O-antigen/teichoic acid export membrane protein